MMTVLIFNPEYEQEYDPCGYGSAYRETDISLESDPDIYDPDSDQGKVNGKYMVGGGTLSQKANNFFGIKADKSWKGKVFNISTGEYTPSGQYYTEFGASVY